MRRVLFGCLFVCALGADAAAELRLTHFTTSNGLPQNTVSAIAQTRDGYLWFGTYDGLVRYDGVRFTIFDKGNTPGIRSNQILAIREDSEGTLWIGTGEGGLIRYRHGVFTSFTTAEGLPDNYVGRLENTADGLIVFMRGVPHRWTGDTAVPLDPVVLSDFVDSRGARWTRKADRLVRTANGRETPFPLALTRDEFSQRYEDPTGAVWFSAHKNGVYRITGDRVEHYGASHGLPPEEWIRASAFDRHGHVWLFGEAWIAQFKDGRFTGRRSTDFVKSGYVRVVFTDREGTAWIGTNENGLFRAMPQVLTTHLAGVERQNRAIYPVFEDCDGTLWLGSARGITRMANGAVTQHAVLPPAPGRLDFTLSPADGNSPGVTVRAFWQDRDGRVWIGINGGLLVLENGRLVDRSALVENVGVDAIIQDRRGRMWIGSQRSVVRIDGDEVTTFRSQDFLPGQQVGAILEDRQGRIWIGTRGGLARYEDNRFTPITTKDGLAGDRIRSLYEDADGVLWVGTFDSGLSRIENGRITNYSMREGLFNNGVFHILEDRRGNFWISCNRGIYRVSRQQLNDFAHGRTDFVNSVAYGSQDGMLSSEANGGRQPAGVKSRDGRLWFPTQNGLVAIDPAAEAYNTAPPAVVVESVVVDGAPVPFAGGIRVEPGQRDVEINYTAPSSIKPEHIQFKYRLIGVSGTWIDAGTRRSVHYSHLPPGNYTFALIAGNSDGIWSEAGVTIPVRVVPYFYQTGWFLLLTAFSLMTTGTVAYVLRIRQLKRSEERLQAVVAARTAELQTAHDRLQALATLDGLTNIANHRRFKEFLAQEWQRTQRTRTPLSLLMIDVDFFKFYNDAYGHQAGDECLKRVAVALAETVQRGTDLAARYGGEEFVVVLTDTGLEGAAIVAETIRARVEAMEIPHSASKVHKVVTVSVGIATRVGDPDIGPDGLIAAADAALYRAKRMGRNRYVLEVEGAML